MKLLKYFTIFIIVLLVSGCSTRGNPAFTKKTFPSSKRNYITEALNQEYKKWDSTPYRYGGENFNGVDCSSFIQQMYKSTFGINLPRTTREQVKMGYKVSRSDSKAGDLVFFKTGYNVRHTGIIIEKGRFMHASQKHGVTKSSLYNPYWRGKYWQTRRILP